jgi:two-component system chemotaxis response regulator CheB
MNDPAQVLIVDDSRIYRSAIEDALGGQDDIHVCGSVFSGAKALEAIRARPPDVVTLDVEMPGMDGLETLQRIQEFNVSRPPDQEVGVIMVSVYTTAGAEATIRALQAGAFDFIEKPNEGSIEQNVLVLRHQLTSKIRVFMQRRQPRPRLTEPAAPAVVVSSPPARHPVRAVFMAVSTGGPRTLAQLLPEMLPRIEQPLFIVQHMPAGFPIAAFADVLARQAGCSVVEATNGALVEPRTTYLAPSGQHLLVRPGPNSSVQVVLTQQPPENGLRPSANVLFRSAAAAYGGDLIAVVLTGMGNDGSQGLPPIKRAGGYVIAQDEASSVVWGMPESAIVTGCVDDVLPLDRISARIVALCQRAPV